MARVIAWSLLLLVPAAAGVTLARHCPGCIDRSRVTRTCEWIGDASFALDPNNPSQHRHLVADAQLAEELAIRYADAEFNRLYGYEAHGGIEGSARNRCMARLVTTIEANHSVTAAQITAARGERNPMFDAVAALSFVPLYVLGALAAAGWIDRRFPSDAPLLRSVSRGLASLAVSFLGLQVGQLWLGVWETIRVRNGHISVFRAASRTIWTHQHGGLLIVASIALFWIVGLTPRQTMFRRASRACAITAGTMLAAMFAEVFVEHAVGYALVCGALAAFLRLASAGERPPQPAPHGVLLH
jgi:hypothetical protein